MRRIHNVAAGLVTAVLMAIVVACSSDSTGGSVTLDLTGSYSLVQLLLGGFIPAPNSTGTLTATTDSIHANIHIVTPDTTIIPHDTTVALSGSYVAKHAGNKDSIYVVLGGALGTVPGSFTITGAAKDTLTLNLQTPAGLFTAIWHKN